jgi:oligopeptide/dipeptide ABC transporter ATP-binding protein
VERPARQETADDILTVQDLRIYYYKKGGFIRSVDGVSFIVPRQTSVGLAGESGSGKTQTALAIMGLTEGFPGIVGGKVWIGNTNLLAGFHRYCQRTTTKGQMTIVKDVSQCKKLQEARLAGIRGEQVAMVFQEPKSSLSPYFSVGEQLRETIVTRHGLQAAERYEELAMPLLARMQFFSPKQILAKYPHQLSGGESQRVMLALALLGNPDLLIADEPTTLLDVVIEYRILELLAALREEKKFALLLITHNLALMKHLVDDVIIMFSGKVIEQGLAAKVISNSRHARHPYTAALVRSATSQNTGSSAMPFRKGALLESTRNGQGCCFYSRCHLKDKLNMAKQRRCCNEEPPLFKVGESHYIACWEMEGQID